MSAAPSSGEIVVGGVRTPVIAAGPAEAREAVVFVHGNPGSRLDWQDLVGRVGEFARALAFDMPGYGQADKPRDFDYTVEGYASFIDGALAELGVERAHLVVHDFGGPWCWEWASRYPERLASVVIFNTGLLLGRWHKVARIWRTPVIGRLAMVAVPYRPFERALTLDGKVPLPEEFIRRMHRDYDRGTRRAVLRLYRASDIPYPAAQRWVPSLSASDPPALIVWGERDPFVGRGGLDQLKQAFPSATVELLPRSGHFPFADDPEGTAAAVLPFLRERTGGAA